MRLMAVSDALLLGLPGQLDSHSLYILYRSAAWMASDRFPITDLMFDDSIGDDRFVSSPLLQSLLCCIINSKIDIHSCHQYFYYYYRDLGSLQLFHFPLKLY